MSETKEAGSTVAIIKAEINRELADAETMKSLADVTFKGLEPTVMKRALLEGMLRGFEFKDFLEKLVYAIPYSGGYSLITSIDFARKRGARSGVVGVDAPVYQYDEAGNVIGCSVTVKKRFPDGYIGEFTSDVDFKEYTTGKNLWSTKPKTMISKVAEMHALRKACPEELAQSYVEEEMQKAVREVVSAPALDLDFYRAAITTAKDKETLERVWADMPAEAKNALKAEVEAQKAIVASEADAVID